MIATSAGGVKEIVRHRKNGWLVAPGDAEALAEAIETLHATPGFAQQLAAQALVDVKQHFSVDVYLEQMTQTIADATR